MKNLLLILVSTLLVACSGDSDNNESNDFSRRYVGQFEINNVGDTNFWCWNTTGTIRVYHNAVDWGDDVEYTRDVYLSPEGSCNTHYFDANYPIDPEYFHSDDEDSRYFWTNIFAGAIIMQGDFLADWTLSCDVTTFESSNLSAISNTIEGVIKQSNQIIGTFSATLE